MDIYQLKGCGTALVTPFEAGGAQIDQAVAGASRLDEAALRRLVRRQIDSGIDFLVPCGTTGESPVLSSKEHFRVVEIVLEEAKGKVPVIAGAGGNNTERVREGIAELENMGVDAILSVSPYYNKPSQEGLYQHYRALAESTRLPILVYNVPGRTGSNVEPKTLERLAAIPNILGVKEASGNIAQIDEIIRVMSLNNSPERIGEQKFRVISGDDALTLPMMALGAHGVISVVSNVAPAEICAMVKAANAGDLVAARKIHRRLLPLMQVLFIEANPIPVKYALAAMGLMPLAYRLPLVPPSAESQAKIKKVLEEFELMPSPESAKTVSSSATGAPPVKSTPPTPAKKETAHAGRAH